MPAPPGYEETPSGLLMPTQLRADALSDLRSPTAWLTSWAGGNITSSGIPVSPQGAMTLAAYYDCIRIIAEDCAKLPLQVLRRLERGREKAIDHPLWPILHDEMNEDMTAMTGREVLFHHALGWGNGYALIQRDRSMGLADGDVIGLYPIHPARVRPTRDRETGRIVYVVDSNSSLRDSPDIPVGIAAEDMIHIKGLGPDGLVGYSVCQMAAESLGISLAAQTFGASFFRNGMSLGGVLEHPGKLSDTAAEHLRISFNEIYGGSWNAGKVGIFEEGMKFSRIGIPPEEAQFLETRQFQVLEVCRWFRMPPHKVAHLADATFSNIEQQNQEYVTDTLLPWLVRGEQEFNRKLLRMTDYYTKHDVRGLLRGDSAARAQFYKDLFMVGALSPNDIREFEDQNPYDGGDEQFLQIQYAPVRKIVDGTARQAPRPLSPVDDRDEATHILPFFAANGANGVHGHSSIPGREEE